MLQWRRLAPGELDHELIWLSVSVISGAALAAWWFSGLPWPVCTFRALTGVGCIGCGATRAALSLLSGDLVGALGFNPLLTCGYLAAAVFDLYAITVLVGRLPRLRIVSLSRQAGRWLRYGVFAALGLNWLWVITHGI